jgi:hypothetical protein
MVEVSWISLTSVDPRREYLALVTYLPRKSYRSVFGFFRKTGAIRNQLKDSRGLVGYSLRAQLLGKKAWTLSVWEDEDALGEFVRKAPHVDTMKSMGPELGEERKFVRWTLLGSEVPPSWDQAFQQLQKG